MGNDANVAGGGGALSKRPGVLGRKSSSWSMYGECACAVHDLTVDREEAGRVLEPEKRRPIRAMITPPTRTARQIVKDQPPLRDWTSWNIRKPAPAPDQ